MSTVKIEPFYFGSEEESIQLNTEKLPGAFQENSENKEKDKSEAKPQPTETKEEKSKEDVVVEEEEKEDKSNVDNDFPDPLNLFNKPSKKDDKEEEAEKQEKLTAEKVDYAGLTDFLIESGVFKDFEGKDTFDYTPESFKALWDAQAKNQASEFLNEERSQFGGAANQLIDYLKDGGTVEDFAANYTQQVDIASIDVSQEDGQERVVKEYYESIGWKSEKIKKHLERLKDESELKEEADDCKTKLVEAIESEREQMLREQQAIAEDRKIRIESFNKQVRDQLYKDSTLADREKKDLDKFVYEYPYQDKQGNKYSAFAVKMNEINQDPKKYAQFLKMIKNFDSYVDKKEAVKEATKNAFSFLKKGAEPLEGAQTKEVIKQKTTSPPGFKFK